MHPVLVKMLVLPKHTYALSLYLVASMLVSLRIHLTDALSLRRFVGY